LSIKAILSSFKAILSATERTRMPISSATHWSDSDLSSQTFSI